MKKFLTIALMIVMALGASAKGKVAAKDFYVGGSFSLSRGGTPKYTYFRILPELGYNLNSKWSIAGSIGYSYKHYTGVDNNMFEIAPYVRHTYFKSGIVGLFVDGGIGVGFGKASYKGGGSSDSSTIFSFGFEPGIALNITPSFSLVAHVGFLGYNGANDAAKAAGYSDEWGLSFDNQHLKFGFYYSF